QQPEKALQILKAADTLSRYVTITSRSQQNRHQTMGMAYRQLGNYRQAEKYLLLAGEGMNERDRINLSIQLTELYEAMGDYKKAYEVYRKYKETEDSLGSHNIQLQVNELETRYRTAEKDK